MRLTIKKIFNKYKKNEKIVCLTAYDAYFAKLADNCVDIILIGDSLGMTVLGYDSTIPVTIDNIIYHTQAVMRGSQKAFIVSDMPFMNSNISIEETCRNASRLMQEAHAQAVKIEGGSFMAQTVKTLVQGGIPVMGHIGILPQQYLVEGGYYVKGKDDEIALLEDALALQDAGAFCIVLEGIEEEIASKITESLNIPTIGIGAGKNCSGQIQVMHDLLAMSEYLPKHSKVFAPIGTQCQAAFQNYAQQTKSGQFPTQDNCF